MRTRKRFASVALACLLSAGAAPAAEDQLKTEAHRPAPGLALTAALINLVYLPVRLPLTVVGAELAGLSGFLTAGDKHVAHDVFGLFDGTQYVTPKMLKGHEPFHFSRYD